MAIFCAELANSLDINLFDGSVQPCCKLDQVIRLGDDEISKLQYKVFDENTEIQKIKKDLQNNKQNNRCKNCWDAEEKNKISWRLDKNKQYDKTVKHLNIQFSNLCNHSCFYCLPKYSTTIIRQKDWVNPGTGEIEAIDNNLDNQKLNKKLLIDLVKSYTKNIKTLDLSFTGGEPFIANDFIDFMHELIDTFCNIDKTRKVIIGISTNTNVQTKYLEQFYNTITSLKQKYNIHILIISSIENIEDRAEYVRDGLVWKNFQNNFDIHYKNADDISIRMTLNAFSVVKIADFFKYFSQYNTHIVYNYANQLFWRMDILDKSFYKEFECLENYVVDNNLQRMFGHNPWYKTIKNSIRNDIENAKIFKNAITNIDKIKNTNWRPVFPEYVEWFDKI